MKLGKTKSLGQKRDERKTQIAKAPKTRTNTPIDKLVADINTRLGGIGRIYKGSDIQQMEWRRRSSGVPSIDYVLSGGYPRGGLIEIGGEFSSGKSSLALESCKHEQRTEGGAIGWVALEPFSKRWSRERGFFLPFSENEAADPDTGELTPIDSFSKATDLEKLRMAEAGITDPYKEVSPFVLIQEERGDVALDAALDMLRSNLFSIIVVDSLGIAKSSKWLEENEVQDASDFPREAKMIGDYTCRAVLALNARYDENNVKSKDGTYTNQTTLIHLNHIGTEIGTQARSAYKKQRIKGGEGNKHNHHAIVFLWKGEQFRIEGKGGKPYIYAQETRAICLKSKLGPAFMEGAYTFYMQPYGDFQTGDIDITGDGTSLALIAGVVERAGAWFSFGDVREQGREKFEAALRANPALFADMMAKTKVAMKR